MIEFLGFLNDNPNNIKLDYQISDNAVNFLDVTVEKKVNGQNTKIYFKPTDRNSYLTINSGHHPTWICNIPKGQILRVRRNCTELEDYHTQVKILRDKFIQKGYQEKMLSKTIQEIANTPRDHCFGKKQPVAMSDQHQMRFITGFHFQFKDVEAIFKKHWHILSRDRQLEGILPSLPKFVYRRAPNFGDRVVKKILDPPGQQTINMI